jgi:hypothetical protein
MIPPSFMADIPDEILDPFQGIIRLIFAVSILKAL